MLAALFLLLAAAAGAQAPREEIAPGLHAGDVLDESNAERARGLLPEEILRHYASGEYRNRIVSYPTGSARWDRAFMEATARNVGALDVDARGTIIDRATGQQPPYLYGLPFPSIDEEDPQAAVKIVWNQFLAFWGAGNVYNRALVAMLNRNGMDREIVADGWFQFYDGQALKYRTANPLNLQSQFLGVALKPADLEGTGSLTWRYRDPDKRDSVWAFIPALRRVRAVSPANRSDSYLGSDISGDDGFFFDGKPEDFQWKLVGRRDALRLVDPASVAGPLRPKPAPGGGWEALRDGNPPTIGLRTAGWRGVAWAPSQAGLAKRPMWIVEAVPRDKYYLYGRVELWIDAETWDGAWNRKYSWEGEPMATYQVMARVNHPSDDGPEAEWVPVSDQAYVCAENLKMNRASATAIRADANAPFRRRVPIEANLFDSSTLHRFGK